MKKSIHSFIQKLKENSDGTISGGFSSIRGGSADSLFSTNGDCTNDGKSCSGTNNVSCTNTVNCSGSNSGTHCSNPGTCM